jgi:hypothetical protein
VPEGAIFADATGVTGAIVWLCASAIDIATTAPLNVAATQRNQDSGEELSMM